MPVTEKISNELSKLTQKRLALESLIRITASIQIQQQSLLELSAIAKPSQEFPVKLLNQIKLLSNRIGKLPIPELIVRLEKIELIMAQNLKNVLLLANIDTNQLRDEQLVGISIDEFIDAIANFKRRTQIAVALRFILKDRGVAIAPYTLSIPQESIVGHIESLRTKEQSCVKKIRKEIVHIIKDSEAMMKMDGLTEKMKLEINDVTKAMKVNLNHLDSGGSVKDIPNVFETIVLESDGKNTSQQEPCEEDKTTNTAKDQEADKTKDESKRIEIPVLPTNSFWILFKKWLSSPWNVSWNKIKQQSSNKNDK